MNVVALRRHSQESSTSGNDHQSGSEVRNGDTRSMASVVPELDVS